MENANPSAIDDPANWAGGFYELAIDMGPPDDSRLDQAMKALWIAAGATGPFVRNHDGTYGAAEIALGTLASTGSVGGTVEAPPFGKVVAGMRPVRLLDGGPDWLLFYLPVGALSRAHPD